MKNRLIILSTFLFSALMFSSCEETELAQLNADIPPNVLSELESSEHVLTKATENDLFEDIQWTEPDFGYNASVTYKVEIDKADGDFSEPIELTTTTNFLKTTLTVKAVNEKLLGLGLNPEEAADIKIRVVSTIHSTVGAIVSNEVTTSVTPYATSFPPIWGMGAALKGWGPWPANAVEWQSSEYKKYSTVAYFTSGETFRWFGQLEWSPVSYNYPFFTSVSPVFENGNDGDLNLRVAATSGWYKVDVDLVAKTVEAEEVDEPLMFMTGAGIGGWDKPGSGVSIKMTYIKPGVFQADAPFVTGEAWRFFAQADWGPVSYNYPFFTGGVPDYFENAGDGDSNIRVVGASGTKKVTVDINTMTVTLGDPPLPKLYITGDDFGWGWNDGQYEEMTYNVATGNFTITTDLTNNNLFRFFPGKGWDNSYTYEYFTTIDSELGDQGPGDHNFRYNGTTGSRTITVNLTTKVVTVD